jgi:DNA-binding transcriptional MerR regulator
VLYSRADAHNFNPMADTLQDVTIPDRPAFKAAEVCEIAKVQPYVLRSWESEFPDLGVAKTPGGPRVYRKADVERVLRIRHLVFGEGLTLAGVRRRLDAEGGVTPKPAPVDDSLFNDVVGADLKARLAQIKAGLKSVLELVSREPRVSLGSASLGGAVAPLNDFHLESPAAATLAHATPKRATATSPRRTKASDRG